MRRFPSFLISSSLLLAALAAAWAPDALGAESRHKKLGRIVAGQAGQQDAPSAQADLDAGERVEVTLQNGARLKARLLYSDRARIVIDLGYQVLTVPASEALESRSLESDQAAETPGPTPGASPSPGNLQGAVVGPFDRTVDRLQEAVVMVSNAGGLGAGFLISPDGLVMTNFHVVRGERLNDVTLFLRNKRGSVEKEILRDAEVKAYSSLLDVAIVQIPPEQLKDRRLPFLEVADPDTIRTGMRVHAIGNPAVGAKVLDHTVSDGIVSSTSRNFNDVLYIQTTAAVNPGNSGGPLLNDRGQVVGMVTFRAFFQEGLAFALPSWYLSHFRGHYSAFAPSGEDKKLGYRYHDPSR